MEKNWEILPSVDKDKVDALSKAINVNTTIAGILVQRNVSNFDEARQFFRPELDHLHDPFLMLNMEKAVERLDSAINNSEKILIYGDYDVDGTTSVALVYQFLSKFTGKLIYYIPDRYNEGYGISQKGVRWAAQEGVNLLISLDCGIRANEQIDLANSLGISVIVCDHHLAGEELPKAEAILNPNQPQCDYPFKGLSGCGVGFKFMQAFCVKKGLKQDQLNEYLELVAISIAADIVPMVDENRTLAYFGLKQVNTNPSLGIKALLQSGKLRHPIDISNVVFGIAPRINASGRIKHAHLGLRLLICKDEKEAYNLAQELEQQNGLRKNIDHNITEQALNLIKENNQQAKSTVLYQEDWHKGVIGIVASRCIEQYYRPTILLTKENDLATGSARSIPGFNVHEALIACSEYLLKFGGHKYAAGLTLPIDKIVPFQQAFEQIVSQTIDEKLLTPQLVIDSKIRLSQVNFKFLELIKQMAPFGPGNKQPVFCSDEVMLMGHPKIYKEQHIKLRVKHFNDQTAFDAIGFGLAEQFTKNYHNGCLFSIAYVIKENHYLGMNSLQLQLRDIKFG